MKIHTRIVLISLLLHTIHPILQAGEEKPKEQLVEGVVKGKPNLSSVTIETKESKTITFKIDADTRFTGRFKDALQLEPGAAVAIMFDKDDTGNFAAKLIAPKRAIPPPPPDTKPPPKKGGR